MAEAETSLNVKKAADCRKSGGLSSGSAAKAAAVSRREKLNEFLEKKRIIEDAKRKKAKPAFKAGTVHYPSTAFPSAGPEDRGPFMSMSSSMMYSSCVFKKPQTLGEMKRSASTLSLRSKKEVTPRNPVGPSQTNARQMASQKKSFAPSNYKFNLNMKTQKNVNVSKVKPQIESTKRTSEEKCRKVEELQESIEKLLLANKKEDIPDFEDQVAKTTIEEIQEAPKALEPVPREASKGEFPSKSTFESTKVKEEKEVFNDEVVESNEVKTSNGDSEEYSESTLEIKEENSVIEAVKEVFEDVKPPVKAPPGEEEKSKESKILDFRHLLRRETERISHLCSHWEDLASSETDISDDVTGEVRSVVGLGRLVMAERFSQFSGLVDNCQFKRGAKETTVEDLQGFWEMIYIQVEDVDRRFEGLKAIKENNWERPQAQRVSATKKVAKTGRSLSSNSRNKPAPKPSSGLKALIAAKRKASKSCSVEVTVTLGESSCQVVEEEKNKTQSEVTFDGGFFKVTSPCLLRKSPKMKSSTLQLRQTAANNIASKQNALLLSPFISAVAKKALISGQGIQLQFASSL